MPKNLANEIANQIEDHVSKNKGFASRSFYGDSFSLALLTLTGKLNKENQKALTDSFQKLDQSQRAFHWEFNRYALFHYRNYSGDRTFDPFIDQGKETPTEATNWVLLRCNLNLLIGKQAEKQVETAKKILGKMQLANGLILDEKLVYSFQYHCFMLAMVIEIYEQTQDPFLKERFQKGVSFIRRFILQNGDTLYVGRGQQQLFGYASLVYVLAQAHLITHDETILEEISRLLKFIKSRRLKDGRLPLVLRGAEGEIPDIVDLKNTDYLGWYGYNNYFDYLAFAGYFFQKASETLSSNAPSESNAIGNYSDQTFLRVSHPRYDAVVSRAGGYLSNDLTFPYLVSNGKAITPCFGGEQHAESLYQRNDLSLPYFPKFNRTLRAKSRAWFSGKSLWMVSPLGVMKRTFVFDADEVNIRTQVWSPFKHVQQYLFYDDNVQNNPNRIVGKQYQINCSAPMKKGRQAYCANGELRLYTVNGKDVTLRVKLTK